MAMGHYHDLFIFEAEKFCLKICVFILLWFWYVSEPVMMGSSQTQAEPKSISLVPMHVQFYSNLGCICRYNWKLAVHLFFEGEHNLSCLIVPPWHFSPHSNELAELGVELWRAILLYWCIFAALLLIVASSLLNCESSKRACWLDAGLLPVPL